MSSFLEELDGAETIEDAIAAYQVYQQTPEYKHWNMLWQKYFNDVGENGGGDTSSECLQSMLSWCIKNVDLLKLNE